VQHSLITAMMLGFRFRLSVFPSEIGALFTTRPEANASMEGNHSATTGSSRSKKASDDVPPDDFR
jgi:hypothetical protein